MIRTTLAAAALSLGLVSALPALAADQTPSANGPTAMQRHRGYDIEQHIKRLHDRLKITDAQAPQWDAVAQVMRDNAKNHQELVTELSKNADTMTAVDDLKAYQQVAEQHAAGIGKLATAFSALYDTMSPEQKKVADQVFREHKHNAHRAMGGAHK